MKRLLCIMMMVMMICCFACDPNDPDNPLNPGLTCVPCGDFMITCEMCDFRDYGCPVCFSQDSELGMTWEYANGAYMTMDSTGQDFYDPSGIRCYGSSFSGTGTVTFTGVDNELCYTAQPGDAAGDMEWLVNNKTYVIHEDGSWTCPNGSSWTLPTNCMDNATSCPDLQDLPSCP